MNIYNKRKYEEIIAEIKLRIRIYKENNLPFTELENKLNSTIDDFKKEYDKAKCDLIKDFIYEKYYKILYDMLLNNKNELNVLILLTFVKFVLNKDDMSNHLDKYVKEAINHLEKVNNICTLGNNIDYTFDKLLMLVIEEIKTKGSSELLNYIKQSADLSYYLNEAARKNAKFIKNKNILIIINREFSKGNALPYIEDDLLKILAENLDYIKLVKSTIDNVKALEESLFDRIEESSTTSYKIVAVKKDRKKVKQHLKKGLLSLLYAISIMSGTYGICCGLYKPFHKVDLYDTCITTYDKDGNLTKENDQLPFLGDGKITYVYEYNTWEEKKNDFKREVIEYDVSNINYADLANYLLLDLERLNIKSKSSIESKDHLFSEDSYSDKHYEVKQYSQNLNDENIHTIYPSLLDTEFVKYNDAIAYLILVLIYIFIGSCLGSYFLNNGIYNLSNFSKKYLKEAKQDLKFLLDRYKEANLKIEEIKNELWNIYTKYSFLLEESRSNNIYLKLVREKEENEKI